MWIPIEGFGDVFDTIREASHTHRVGINVLVGSDCDALCAQRIFARVCDRFFLQFKATPVLDNDSIQRLFEAEQDTRLTWVLLNCGACVDVSDYAHPTHHKVYLIDSRRPVHRNNILAPNVFVFDDGPAIEEAHVLLGIGKAPEEAAEKQPEEAPSKRRRLDAEAEREYYRGGKHSQSTAVSLFLVADQLNHSDMEDVLWMAIVGLTDHFLLNKISKDLYRAQMALFHTKVSTRLLRKPTQVSMEGYTAPKFHEGRIVAQEESAFFLLRHWSLYQSMIHSPAVCKMGLNGTQKGKQQLGTLLCKAGISITQRNATFTTLSEEVQRTLPEMLAEHGPAYGLADFRYLSFFKWHGYGFGVSAGDLVYCISAMLEKPTHAEDAEGEYRKCFWEAYEMLTSDCFSTLEASLTLAKAQQEALVRQATLVLMKDALVHTGPFRYVCLPETTDVNDLKFLTKPIALKRMARFLLEVRIAHVPKSSKQHKPLVLATFNAHTQWWLVVGVHPERADGGVEKDRFSAAFQEAALRSRAPVRYTLQLGCVSVHKDHLVKFIDALHNGMLEGY
eukprot:NODE_676_length_1958_cov_25.015292_g627_i0.p1 GENE.NODE_676_length_1958_cov_25.015292_g627_i0~~NODE_676_length_1958_cov_25.015292_g627_i0.p1  ORF type:complete len:586 (-),score=183.12 NODE_676_length_1958_cov_25.015292_g627_i0:199-1881(-)